LASKGGAVIISKDEDFSIILRADAGPQVVWVRLGNCGNDVLLARMAATWDALLAELEGGAKLIEIR
jgi:predicted nuclease of predicted toxin-antitoxin system